MTSILRPSVVGPPVGRNRPCRRSDLHRPGRDRRRFYLPGRIRRGVLQAEAGERQVGLQAIALGKGKFHLVVYHGGLPVPAGRRARRSKNWTVNGRTAWSSSAANMSLPESRTAWSTMLAKDGSETGRLKRSFAPVHVCAGPPPGAVVLFDGKSAEAFDQGRITADGLLMQGCSSKQKFGSCQVHIEFRTPYQPEDRGQGCGNSGIYVGARYECQMLDSFGLKGKNNECGGLYSVKCRT